MDKQNRTIILVLVVVAVLLIGGGWIFYNYLGSNTEVLPEESKLQTELEVIKMKNLAEENLEFFNPENATSSLWYKLDKSFQYDALRYEPDIDFDLNNTGNLYPFAQPPEEE